MTIRNDLNLYEMIKPSSRWKYPTCSLLTLLISCGISVPIDTFAVDWSSLSGGSFGAGSNWVGGAAPSVADAANFNLGSAGYNVNLMGNRSAVWLFSSGLIRLVAVSRSNSQQKTH